MLKLKSQIFAMHGYDNNLNLDENYKVPILAKILHSLPHLNITFHRTNNTFRPTDEIYLEVSIKWWTTRERKKSIKISLSHLISHRTYVESGNFGIPPCSCSHCFALSASIISHVEMLRSKAKTSSFNNKPQSDSVDCDM